MSKAAQETLDALEQAISDDDAPAALASLIKKNTLLNAFCVTLQLDVISTCDNNTFLDRGYFTSCTTFATYL